MSDADDFERLVAEQYGAAFRFAFSLTCNHEDACDLTQQAFCIAQDKLQQLNDGTKAKQWLFTILHREFLRTIDAMRCDSTTMPK